MGASLKSTSWIVYFSPQLTNFKRRFIIALSCLSLVIQLFAFPPTASAAPGNILPPFDTEPGQQWNICQGYNGPVSHTGTSQYGLDLTGSGCGNSATGRNVRAPIAGTVYYYQASYGNLCINVSGGRSLTLTHINSNVTSGSVTAGQIVGNVAAAGLRGNGGVAHIHFQMWATPNCYSSSGIPFDSAHGARICGAPDLTPGGAGSNGNWSGTSFAGASCDSGTAFSDGTFLALSGVGIVYRIVGGAPVRLYNQGAIPGYNGGTVTWVSQAQLNALPQYPRDGAFMNIQEAGGTGVYTFAGGAPIRLYNWGTIPGFSNAVSVNFDSLVNLDHMRPLPQDGAYLSIAEAGGGGIYRIVGGAPIRITNQGAIPGYTGNVVWINSQSLATLDHMNARPADGSTISIAEAGGSGIYTFVGGAPLRLYNWGPIPGFSGPVDVNFDSLINLDHMNAVPKDGSYIASLETGIVHRIAGGSPLVLSDWGALPGYSGAVWVNQETIDTYDHMLSSPANGTVLQGYPSNNYWVINNGTKSSTTSQPNAITVNDTTINAIP